MFFGVRIMVLCEADWARVTVGSKGMNDLTGIFLASLLWLPCETLKALPLLCSGVQPCKDR